MKLTVADKIKLNREVKNILKFIHIADLHADRTRLEPCLKVLHTLRDFIKENTDENGAPVLLIAGDFWHSTITNTKNSGFTEYLEAMGEISDLTDVYMVSGTASHEPSGSLDCFTKLGIKVFNTPDFVVRDSYRIFAIPEPRKSNYTATSQKELTALILDDLRKTIDSFKEELTTTKVPINCLMYHGEIAGVQYQNGAHVPGSSYAMPGEWLKELNMDYIACGHIHMDLHMEKIGNCYYSGSCYPVNFGETLDCGFNLIEIEED